MIQPQTLAIFDVEMVLGKEWHFLQRPEAMKAM
jgi:hypothetical protein